MGRKHIEEDCGPRHKTEILNLDGFDCEIDLDMVPLIKWFYSKGARTHFCCQGDDLDGMNSQPYVIWLCEDYDCLIDILEDLTTHKGSRVLKYRRRKSEVVYIETKVEYFEDQWGYDAETCRYVRYITRWPSNSSLKEFLKHINVTS